MGSGKAKYQASAPWYDLISAEPVYRAGRVAGVHMLGAQEGDVVLDLGCGTGMNFALLQERIGPRGHIIALDRSEAMLDVATQRAAKRGWHNVTFVQADATRFGRNDLPRQAEDGVDGIFATYSVSVTGDPAATWKNARAVVRAGGRATIVDMQRPIGLARVWEPLALAACAAGGSDIDAHPWRHLEREATAVQRRSLRGGHIQVAAGTL